MIDPMQYHPGVTPGGKLRGICRPRREGWSPFVEVLYSCGALMTTIRYVIQTVTSRPNG